MRAYIVLWVLAVLVLCLGIAGAALASHLQAWQQLGVSIFNTFALGVALMAIGEVARRRNG